MWLFWCIYFSYRRHYCHAFILVTGDITVTAGNDTDVAFKNCAIFSKCKIEIINVFIDEANHTYIAMPMYNLIEYSDNYSDTSGSLWQFKREEPPANNVDLNVNNGVLILFPQKYLNKELTYMNYLVHPFKVLKDYLFLLILLMYLLHLRFQIMKRV